MQKYTKWLLLILVAVLIAPSATKTSAQASSFQLTSPGASPLGVFTTQQIANTFGCSGGNVSPEFDWSGAPSGTQSFGLNIFDMDAPTGSGFWHWVVFNIPASATSLPAGAGDPTKNVAPAGTIQAHNDGGMAGYVGPCPPQGDKPHRYLVTIFALKIDKIPLDATASAALVGFYLNGNAIAKTSLVMLYGQPSTFKLTSDSVTKDSAFQNEQAANTFGCTGGNLSPALSWTGAPDGTKSYALTMYDVDAPTGSGLWHWVLFNLPASTTSL